jgi:hypothetical protein
MAKGALARAKKAVETAVKTADAEKRLSGDKVSAAVGLEAAKRKKTEEQQKLSAQDFFSHRHTMAAAIPIYNVTAQGSVQEAVTLRRPSGGTNGSRCSNK